MSTADLGRAEVMGNEKKRLKIVEELRRHGIVSLMAGGKEFMLHATAKMLITPHVRRYKREDEELPLARRSIRR